MWAYRLDGPGFVSRYERADDDRKLGPGQVRLRFKAAGLCGSDMPKLNGIIVRKGTLATITDALRAVASQGGLTLRAGRTLGGWLGVLRDSRDYLLRYREDFKGYISHEIPVSDAQAAYSLYARPQAGRLKVAIVGLRRWAGYPHGAQRPRGSPGLGRV